MTPIARKLAVLTAIAALALNWTAFAQPKGKGEGKGAQEGKEKKAKQHKHQNGKDLLGEKIKKNGRHELQRQGKHTTYVDVQDGKIRGVSVKHAEKGDVPVTKYKTNKKMVDAGATGIVPVNLLLTQAQSLGTTYIGYSYIDDWGDEVIYWFPYEMIYDGDTGAVDYVPVY